MRNMNSISIEPSPELQFRSLPERIRSYESERNCDSNRITKKPSIESQFRSLPERNYELTIYRVSIPFGNPISPSGSMPLST